MRGLRHRAIASHRIAIAEPAPSDGERIGVRDYATDPEQAARLWALSAELTGVDAFSASH
jgi:hypothetical protein